jgi:purine catabolism regulator
VLGALGPGAGGLSEAISPEAGDGEFAAAAEAARSLSARARDAVLDAGAAPPTLLDVLGPRAASAFADAVLGPVRALPDGAVLVAGLRAYLDAHGALAAAADVLGVHRHTLRARLRRVESALGRDLDAPGVRAELWVALSAQAP